uniref:Putative methyltransferase n=1 Tax=viral metagenome TaxID=1070528 RepID=A0A6M3KSB2_9ZZZZ
MKQNRIFATANHNTFSIPPIKELLERYVGSGFGWVDPFARNSKVAEITNDMNPETTAQYHLDALDFIKEVPSHIRGVLFDPPYSYRQISEHYKVIGKKATYKDTSYNFYRRIMIPLTKKIEKGGYVISCGWNSNGFGKKLGFLIVEILLVAHGLHHNDTIVTVEKKL